ncbi:dihydroxyacetone kinase subunit DhaL [Streptomyces sp. NPDC005438]|uniref:dihydroxyacetone kinase subunit DhaL n=1 Tax=Streptomyces sp. NPDC005438 TaxID=3156880 RepID=UPI0033BB6EE8
MTSTTPDQRRFLLAYAEAAHQAHEVLTRLDQLSGDGDFGDNLREGLDRVVAALAEQPDTPPVTVAAGVFLDEVGGTSGPLLGLIFQELGRALAEDSGPGAWARGVREGLAAVQRVGEAEVGDRTLVDALVPARDALEGSAPFAEVAAASWSAALDTARLRARRGRASYVGDRAVGHPDPGAVGVALMFQALARAGELEPSAGYGELLDQLRSLAYGSGTAEA